MKQPNLRYLLENVVTHHEGFSYNIYNGECNPQTGYMVALRGFQRVVKDNEPIIITGREYVKERSESLVNEEAFIGCWVDKANNRIVFDISKHVHDLTEAIQLAEQNSQEAIWDCKNEVEIYLDSPKARLELLRIELREDIISMGELAELQSLVKYIDPTDVELLEAAGVPELPKQD